MINQNECETLSISKNDTSCNLKLAPYPFVTIARKTKSAIKKITTIFLVLKVRSKLQEY